MANTFTIFGVADYARQQVNDPQAAWLPAAALNAIIARHIVIPETTFYFYLDTTGYYTTRGQIGESGAILFKNITTPWTATSTTATFQVDCRGTIVVSAGTDLEVSPIAILGARIDIGELMGELLMMDATRDVRTRKDAINIGDSGMSPIMPEDRTRKMAEYWRGYK